MPSLGLMVTITTAQTRARLMSIQFPITSRDEYLALNGGVVRDPAFREMSVPWVQS